MLYVFKKGGSIRVNMVANMQDKLCQHATQIFNMRHPCQHPP